MSKPRSKGMMKNSRGHGSESEPEIMSKEELEEIEKLNKSVNEDVFKALEARDQFTQNCIGLDKSKLIIQNSYNAAPPIEK